MAEQISGLTVQQSKYLLDRICCAVDRQGEPILTRAEEYDLCLQIANAAGEDAGALFWLSVPEGFES